MRIVDDGPGPVLASVALESSARWLEGDSGGSQERPLPPREEPVQHLTLAGNDVVGLGNTVGCGGNTARPAASAVGRQPRGRRLPGVERGNRRPRVCTGNGRRRPATGWFPGDGEQSTRIEAGGTGSSSTAERRETATQGGRVAAGRVLRSDDRRAARSHESPVEQVEEPGGRRGPRKSRGLANVRRSVAGSQTSEPRGRHAPGDQLESNRACGWTRSMRFGESRRRRPSGRLRGTFTLSSYAKGVPAEAGPPSCFSGQRRGQERNG